MINGAWSILMAILGTLASVPMHVLADERGFLRLYRAPDGDAGGGDGNADDDEPDDDAGDDDPKGQEPDEGKQQPGDDATGKELKKLRRELAARRRENRDLAAKVDKLLEGKDKPPRQEPDDDDPDDALEQARKDREEEQRKREQSDERAKRVLARAKFTEAALKAEIDPKRIDAAFKLADLSDIEVDLEAETVDGLDEIAEDVAEQYPEFKVSKTDDQDDPPEVDNGAPGGNRGRGININELKRGDVMEMSDEDLAKLLEKGVRFITPSEVPGEPDRVMEFRHGGNETAQRIRKFFGGDSKLLDPGYFETGGAQKGK